MTLRVLSLFAGIGGFDLGLERTGGFKTVAFCETNRFCQRVLAKHWPEVNCYDDVRALTAERLASDGLTVDAIAAGFPCQDLSKANMGRGQGLDGARSGLWFEVERLVGEIRPSLVLLENVTDLLADGFGAVLGALAALGYDVEWDCVPAFAVGAPHPRDRVFVVAYANGQRLEGQHGTRQPEGDAGRGGHDRTWSAFDAIAPADWLPEPAIRRVVDGVPDRMDRLRAVGNAVVPAIAEMIGRGVLAAEAEAQRAAA